MEELSNAFRKSVKEAFSKSSPALNFAMDDLTIDLTGKKVEEIEGIIVFPSDEVSQSNE